MANNTTLNTGSGGDSIRDIDKGTFKTPVSLIDIGGAGTENLLVAGQNVAASSIPVTIASNQPTIGVSCTPVSSGGLTTFSYISTGTGNQDSSMARSGPCQLYGWALANTNASARWLKIYDTNFVPTSSGLPKMRLFVPGGGGNNRDISNGIQFSGGIAFRITANIADNDTNSATLNDVAVNFDFK